MSSTRFSPDGGGGASSMTGAAASSVHGAAALSVHGAAAPGRSADLAVALDVIDAQSTGIAALRAALSAGPVASPLAAAFIRAVDIIAALPGRVITSGIGKSGHVARKVQATLASTGTPASFVHPSEASHGDLGMVLQGDAVIALSNSGETAELADLVGHTRRFAIPLLAITSRPDSTLARAADIVLALPPAAEACPITAAPTTSTTMQMMLGDALAVALLRRRGFTANDFGVLHPGGRLGAGLKRVGELMHAGEALPLGHASMTLPDAVVIMTRKAFGCLGVLDGEGRLAGLITDGDLRRALDRDLRTLDCAAVMNTAPRTTTADTLAVEALRQMNDGRTRMGDDGAGRRPITSLFVLDDARRPVGILHIHDLLRAGVA